MACEGLRFSLVAISGIFVRVRTVTIVGPGRLGGALAIALSRTEFAVQRVVYKNSRPSARVLDAIEGRCEVVSLDGVREFDSDVTLLVTPDTELAEAAESIASRTKVGTILLHSSGALSSEVLFKASQRGISVGSMHPLVSVSDPVKGAGYFANAYFCVEGPAAAEASELVRALGGKPFTIGTEYKPLYHAAAVLASGHITALYSAAVGTLSRCGVPAERGEKILMPLLSSAVGNIAQQGVAQALTGPFARSDIDAVRRHLKAFDLAGLADEKRIYLELGLAALELARETSGDQTKINKIGELIKLAQASAK